LSGTPADERLPAAAAWGGYPGGLPVEKGDALFPRIKAEA
jgi:methionyl-tRNA synthetase